MHFIATLQVGDTRCASDVNAPFHAFGAPSATGDFLNGVARFPRLASQALPARVDPASNDISTLGDRQLVSVAWSSVEDAVTQTLPMTGTTGRGLRGGTFTVTHTSAATTITYRNARFSDDVAVSGTATLDQQSTALNAQVTVGVQGSQGGTLSFHGLLDDPARPTVRARGQLGGRSVALLTLAN